MTDYNATFTTPGTIADVTLRLSVSVTSQSQALNQTTLAWSLRLVKGSAGSPFRSFNDCVAAVTVSSSVYSASNLNYNLPAGTQNVLVASGSKTVTHLSDGTKSITVSASYNGRDPIGTAAVAAFSLELPPIPRNYAKVGVAGVWEDAEVYVGVNGAWSACEIKAGVSSAWVATETA